MSRDTFQARISGVERLSLGRCSFHDYDAGGSVAAWDRKFRTREPERVGVCESDFMETMLEW